MGVDAPHGVEPIRPIAEKSPEVQLYEKQLHEIFGSGEEVVIKIFDVPGEAKFRKEIDIETTLKDGFVEGGQKVKIHTHQPGQILLAGDGQWQGIYGFAVDSISINDDVEIQKDLPPIRLIPPEELEKTFGANEQQDTQSEDVSTESATILDFQANRPGAYLTEEFPGKDIICTGVLEYGDDIGVLIHEAGHNKDPDNAYIETQPVRKERQADVQALHRHKERIEANQNEKRGFINRWLYALRLEVQANKRGLDAVTRGPYAKNWEKIFPSDHQSGYLRLFKFLEYTNYLRVLNGMNGWYKNNADPEEIPRFYPPGFNI